MNGKTKHIKRPPALDKAPNGSANGSSSKAKQAVGRNSRSSSPVYCLCLGPDDHRWMIQCDGCEDWFHGECVDLNSSVGDDLVESFICPRCLDVEVGRVTRYRKICSLGGCQKPARLCADEEDEAANKQATSGDQAAPKSAFCCNDHRDEWWIRLVTGMPTRRAVDADPAVKTALSQDQLLRVVQEWIERPRGLESMEHPLGELGF